MAGPRPYYLQLADELTRAIGAGEYVARDRFPTEAALTAQFGLSRVTVRRALSILEDRGLITRRPGAGTMVNGSLLHHDLGRSARSYQELVAQGFEPTVRVLEWRRAVAPPNVAARLGSKHTMLNVRLYEINGAPLALHHLYYCMAARAITREQSAFPAPYVLEKLLGFTVARTDVKVRAAVAGKRIARLLAIKPTDPVLVFDRTRYDEADQPLENTISHMRSDAYEFGISLPGSGSIATHVRPD